MEKGIARPVAGRPTLAQALGLSVRVTVIANPNPNSKPNPHPMLAQALGDDEALARSRSAPVGAREPKRDAGAATLRQLAGVDKMKVWARLTRTPIPTLTPTLTLTLTLTLTVTLTLTPTSPEASVVARSVLADVSQLEQQVARLEHRRPGGQRRGLLEPAQPGTDGQGLAFEEQGGITGPALGWLALPTLRLRHPLSVSTLSVSALEQRLAKWRPESRLLPPPAREQRRPHYASPEARLPARGLDEPGGGAAAFIGLSGRRARAIA